MFGLTHNDAMALMMVRQHQEAIRREFFEAHGGDENPLANAANFKRMYLIRRWMFRLVPRLARAWML